MDLYHRDDEARYRHWRRKAQSKRNNRAGRPPRVTNEQAREAALAQLDALPPMTPQDWQDARREWGSVTE